MDANRMQTKTMDRQLWTGRQLRRSGCATTVLLLVLLLGPAGSGVAGELYLSADLGISGGFATSGGSTPYFGNSGSDVDSAPTYGFTFGFEAPMNEPLRENWQDLIPSWPVMVDLEFIGGRDFEFLTDGGDPYRSEVTSWTAMHNARLDIPLGAPIERLFGRLPILEPLAFYTTAGVGVTINDVSTTDNVSRGSDTVVGFAWQVGAGFAYELSRHVSLSAGYRYVDLGDVDLDLELGPTPFGNFTLDVTAHEFAAAVRVRFFPVALRGYRDR
jgi:opacity protein-like surface antigen